MDRADHGLGNFPSEVVDVRVDHAGLVGGLEMFAEQFFPAENLAGFSRLLKKAGNKDFKTLELAGLNHLFQTAVTGNPDEYAMIDETISPAVLQVITDWIKQHTH